MITEDYVSYNIAKLLKEKGFNEKCIAVYHDKKLQLVSSLGIFSGNGHDEQIVTYTNSECEWSPIMIAAPTLQMAMKWLREVYDLHIIAYPWRANKKERIHWCCHVYKSFNLFGRKYTNETLKSYEEACEKAIRYCLEKLI